MAASTNASGSGTAADGTDVEVSLAAFASYQEFEAQLRAAGEFVSATSGDALTD